MSFFLAAMLAAFSGVLHLASQRQAFTSVCRYGIDLCQYPNWPLVVAVALVVLGLLFRLHRL